MSNPIWSRGAILASMVFLASCVNAVASAENTAATCGDNLDNDLDGSADCFDLDCAEFPSCNISSNEDCIGGADEDNDNRIDCQDPDCLDGNLNNSLNDSFCTQSEVCDDLEDNDGDGLTDCDDPSCNGNPNCPEEIFELCDNGTDDDQDGFTDCEDTDCAAVPSCNTPGLENCSNGVDDDDDTFVDCDDAECINAANCVIPGVCGDNLKNQPSEQCDGADLGAESCVSQGFASGNLSCNADCTLNTSACVAAPDCGNGNINVNLGEQCDGANLGGQDCVTRGFAGGTLACSAGCQFDVAGCVNVENCVNGLDDDLDGQADCLDSECAAAPSCAAAAGDCASPFIVTAGVVSNRDTTTGANINASTGAGGCLLGFNKQEHVYAFTAPTNGTASINLLSASDLGFYVRASDVISAAECNPGFQVDCQDAFIGGAAETGSGGMNAGGVIYIFVDGCETNCNPAANTAGPYTLTVTFQ